MVTSCGSLKSELPSRIQLGARPDIVTNRLPNAVAAGREDEAGRIARGRCCPLAVRDAVIDEMEADHITAWFRVVSTGPARPFFVAASVGVLAPPDGLEPPTQALGRPRSVH